MSSQFTVKLKRKGTSVNGAPTLMWLCTTPARELASNVSSIIWGDGKDSAESIKDLTEYDEVFGKNEQENDSFSAIRWHVLDKATLNDIIEWYRSRIQTYTNDKKDAEKEIKDLRALAVESKSVEVAQSFLDRISSIKEVYQDIDSDIAEIQSTLNDFLFVRNIVDDSDNADWELVYYVD